MFLVYFLLAIISYIAGASCMIDAFSHPLGLLTAIDILGTILFMGFGFFLYLRFFSELGKSIYKMRDKYLAENDLHEDDTIILRHEKEYVNSPKRLVSITVNGTEYLTDECQVFRISSYHEAYAFNYIPGKVVLVVRDEHKGRWNSYSR